MINTIFIFWILVFFSFPAFAKTIDFLPKSSVVKERGDFSGGGKPGARIPFVKSQLVLDPERGTVLEMDFNVSQGFGGTYLIFHPKKLPQDFNTVSFWLRGIHSAFKVELKDDKIHSFVVDKADRNVWQHVVIPLNRFSNAKHFKIEKTEEFVFVFEDYRTSPRLGKIYVADLTFSRGKNQTPNSVLETPGAVSIHKEQTAPHVLNLSSGFSSPASLKNFRFEASWDGQHWFLLAEFSNQKQNTFAFSWDVSRYLEGSYFLRALSVDEFGNRKEGATSQIQLQNTYDVESFLDQIQKRTFDYFLKEVHPLNYLVKDRTEKGSVFSTGLSGFQFTAYIIGVERGWMERAEAVKRMNRTLDFLMHDISRYHGLVPHWLDAGGREVWELGMGDVVETTFILAGALSAQQYFDQDNPEEVSFRAKVDRFYRDIKWEALLKRPKPGDEKGLLPWHWSKKAGPSKLEVRGYNEGMIVYLLAMGAPQNEISSKSWEAWASSYQTGSYGPYEFIACAPLFTHQYSHLWIDFRNIRDRYANYFENSILATLANREFSFKANGYSPEIWGLTASEGPNQYKSYGAPPLASAVPVINDGTIAPTAAATSIMFTPYLSIPAMKHMYDEYGDHLWGPYGFKDAFNPNMNWFSDLYLGLDQGPILIAIENYRTGLIWKLFMKNSHIQKGLQAADFYMEKEKHV